MPYNPKNRNNSKYSGWDTIEESRAAFLKEKEDMKERLAELQREKVNAYPAQVIDAHQNATYSTTGIARRLMGLGRKSRRRTRHRSRTKKLRKGTK